MCVCVRECVCAGACQSSLTVVYVSSVAAQSNGKPADRSASDEPTYQLNFRTFIAIDLGMTFSGFAYVIGKESNKYFIQPQSGCGARKMPTAVLLNKNKELHAFGKEAREKYSLLDEEELGDWYFFDRFKMMLNDVSML